MNMREIPVVVAGTGFEGRAAIIAARCKEGARVDLVREPANQFDQNAIAVYLHGSRMFGLLKSRDHIGYIQAARAKGLVKKMDLGQIQILGAYVRTFYAPPTEKIPRVSLVLQVQDIK
jgi:hypothetical protein